MYFKSDGLSGNNHTDIPVMKHLQLKTMPPR